MQNSVLPILLILAGVVIIAASIAAVFTTASIRWFLILGALVAALAAGVVVAVLHQQGQLR